MFVEVVSDGARLAAAALFVCCQILLAIYGFHRFVLVVRDRRRGPARTAPPRPESELPAVTVQLPVFNEPQVVARAVDAACALDYPADRFEIQVLDDSTDGATTRRAEARAAHHRARGIRVRVLLRARRDGFKAGALAAGLASARGEFLAVMDADFVPRPDFLRRAMAAFDAPQVGLVQARWGHLNPGFSLLTDLQSVLLDAHFLIEQPVRAAHGHYFNFNGTAGVWRRTCVEAAGGWQSDTLTEDLDLSYRAQLMGFRFRFLEDLVVPAELPVDIAAFQSQQRRWAKGSLQTARKVLPRVWRSRVPLGVKLEAAFHLTSNLSYLFFLASAVLLPIVLFPKREPGPWGILFWAALFASGTLGVLLFFARTVWRRGDRGIAAVFRVPGALTLGMGMALSQSRAVWEGLTSWGGRWERTAKHGVVARGQAWHAEALAGALPPGAGEGLLAVYFAAVAAAAIASRQWAPVPFLGLLTLGLSGIAALSACRPKLGPAAPSLTAS